jgi:site-specific recombinase XerD
MTEQTTGDFAKCAGELVTTGGDLAVILGRPADRNPAAVYLASLKATGRRAMAGHLRAAAAILGYGDPAAMPWPALRFQHVAMIRTKLQESGKAPASVNGALYALRGVAKAAFDLGLMDAGDYERVRDVKPVRGERLPKGRALTPGELGALLDTCANDPTPAGARDAALIALLYGAGLRRSEAIGLDLANLAPESGELRVRGKGDKERLLYLTDGAALAVGDWLTVRGVVDGPLFMAVNKGGRVIRERMTSQAVYNILRKRGQEAGVRDFSPHDMRRSFVSSLLDAGADISTVQKLAGHASVTTTQRYDRRGEESKRKAIGLLHVPYRGRRAL